MRAIVLSVLSVLMSVLVGCATVPGEPKPPPPSIADIVRMSRDKVPEDEIIRLLHESSAVYRLSGSELAKLKDDGVGPKVLDYLNQAQINQARYEEWARSREPVFWYGPSFGYYYFGPPWPHRRPR